MKSFTDLSQSKVLAEILPLESADMQYISFRHEDDTIAWIPQLGTPSKYDIPCWSLSSLLDVLPPYLFELERGIDLNVYPHLTHKGWHCSYMPNNIESMQKDKFKLITSEDNLIDACVAMIEKLHKQKLL